MQVDSRPQQSQVSMYRLARLTDWLQVSDLRSKARQGFARPAAASAQQSDAAISAAISTKVQQRRCQRQQLPETNSTQQVGRYSRRPV